MSALSLASLSEGASGKICGFTLAPDVRQRLLEMGLTKGTTCTLIRFAPLGDPLELEVRGYRLSLRKSEAEGVLLETP
jgi:Fe2+ transport system protein FeoA